MAEDKFAYGEHGGKEDSSSGYFDYINKRSDRTLTIVLSLYLLFGFVIAGQHDTWLVALLLGGLSFIAFLTIRLIFPDKSWHRYVGSLVMGLFTAQFIYQMQGAYEMHFFAFISATMLIMYQNWRIQIPLFLTVVVHYLVFSFMESRGVEGIFLSQDGLGNDLETFLLHAGLGGVIFGICFFWSHILHKRSVRLMDQLKLNDTQLNYLETNIAFAKQIADGELEHEHQPDEGDELGNTLIKLRDNIKGANEKESIEKFYNIGLAEIGQILRDYDDEFRDVANKLISQLVNYFGANQGGLYLVEKGEDGEEYLDLVAFYAWERQKYSNQHIERGEGLVGQAFQEEETIYLTKVPEDYIKVTSGLGHANPNALLIVPLKVNETVYGVIELAAFGEFEAYKISFMEKLGESIASSVANHKTTAYTRQLLQESQMMTEQMQTQEEEMRQNVEELKATQEELMRKEKAAAAEVEELKARLKQ